MPNYISSAQAYKGQQRAIFHQNPYLESLPEGAQGGVCNGLALHWIQHHARKLAHSFWDWANSEQGIQEIARLQLASHGKDGASSSSSSSSFDRDEMLKYQEDLLGQAGLKCTAKAEVSLDGDDFAERLSEALVRHTGYVKMSLHPRDRDAHSGHALAAFVPPAGGLYFVDANQGEAYFGDEYLPIPSEPVEKWNLTKFNEAFDITQDHGLSSPGPVSGSHQLVSKDVIVERLPMRPSLGGWSNARRPSLPSSPLVRSLMVAPDDEDLGMFVKFLDFYFRKTNYQSRYYACKLRFYH